MTAVALTLGCKVESFYHYIFAVLLLKFNFKCQYSPVQDFNKLRFGGQIYSYINLQNYVKMRHTIVEILPNFQFKRRRPRHEGFWKFEFFSSQSGSESQYTSLYQNWSNGFGIIAFNVFSKQRSCRLAFFKFSFFWTAVKDWMDNTCIYAKFRQNWPTGFRRYHDFPLSRWLQSVIARQVGRANMHGCTIFHQNRVNGCIDITFNVFQNGGCPPSWI